MLYKRQIKIFFVHTFLIFIIHSAPRIVKFESRFITTVDVVHNLALLARLPIYLHLFTHALVHAHRPTTAHIQSHNRTFTPSHTYTHLYTQLPYRHTNTRTHNIHIHS